MAKNNLSVKDQIDQLLLEYNKLLKWDSHVKSIIKEEFHMDRKEIHKLIDGAKLSNEFEAKICSYFGLKNEQDKVAFLEIMCAESSLNFFNNKRTNNDA